MSINTKTNDLPTTQTDMVFLNTEQVATALGCSLPTARRIRRRPDFPLIRVGKNMKVAKNSFLKWAETRRI